MTLPPLSTKKTKHPPSKRKEAQVEMGHCFSLHLHLKHISARLKCSTLACKLIFGASVCVCRLYRCFFSFQKGIKLYPMLCPHGRVGCRAEACTADCLTRHRIHTSAVRVDTIQKKITL